MVREQEHRPGGLYSEGRFNGGVFALRASGGLIIGGAYTWRGIFSEFYGILECDERRCKVLNAGRF